MMKHEFDAMLGKEMECSDMDWEIVEMVYMWHPTLDRADAKSVSAKLYGMMGVRPFLEMYDTATKAKDLQAKVTEAKQALEAAKLDYDEFHKSNR